jgi:hypothetical protein
LRYFAIATGTLRSPTRILHKLAAYHTYRAELHARVSSNYRKREHSSLRYLAQTLVKQKLRPHCSSFAPTRAGRDNAVRAPQSSYALIIELCRSYISLKTGQSDPDSSRETGTDRQVSDPLVVTPARFTAALQASALSLAYPRSPGWSIDASIAITIYRSKDARYRLGVFQGSFHLPPFRCTCCV